MKPQKLSEYIESVGMFNATVNLKKPDPTLRGRVRSGSNWWVIEVGKPKVLKCALIDED